MPVLLLGRDIKMGTHPFAAGRGEGTQAERMMISDCLQPVHFINLVLFRFEASGGEKGLGVLTMPVGPQGWGALSEWGDGPDQHHSRLKCGQNATNAQQHITDHTAAMPRISRKTFSDLNIV